MSLSFPVFVWLCLILVTSLLYADVLFQPLVFPSLSSCLHLLSSNSTLTPTKFTQKCRKAAVPTVICLFDHYFRTLIFPKPDSYMDVYIVTFLVLKLILLMFWRCLNPDNGRIFHWLYAVLNLFSINTQSKSCVCHPWAQVMINVFIWENVM